MGYPAPNHLRMIEECSSLFHVRGWVERFSAGLFLQEEKRFVIRYHRCMSGAIANASLHSTEKQELRGIEDKTY